MVSKFGNWAKYSEFGKKFEFHPSPHRYIGHAGKNWEKSEKSVTRHFFSIWWLSSHKNIPNYILTKFQDIPFANSMIFSGPKLLLEIMKKQQKSVPNMFKILAQLPLKRTVPIKAAQAWYFPKIN